MSEFHHIPVLLHEAVAGLNIQPNGIYVDATLGGGGHTSRILQSLDKGHLFSFDQDPAAIHYNREHLRSDIQSGKLTLVNDNFRHLRPALSQFGVTKVDGILYDLGVSSPQFDDPKRGFSYRTDAPLDMRMNTDQKLTAQTVVNEWSEQKLRRILRRYGEERFAGRIAHYIVESRQRKSIETTFELVDVIKEAIPAAARRHGGHPAKRSFQAIRVAVNDELGALEDSLEAALTLLNVHGRISVITFQSLEDRLVKTMFKEKTTLPEDIPSGLPVIPEQLKPQYRLVNHKPIEPSATELQHNHRAHSAKLRIIERMSSKD